MPKKDYSNFIILILILLLGVILLKPSFVMQEVIMAMNAFITKYFPAVFPIYIITDLLINYHFPLKLAKKLQFFCKKVFHCDGNALFVILMSMISGFPSGAKYTRKMLDDGMISLNTANYLITFTHFSNPLFILGTCFLITKNRALTVAILICHFLANGIIAFVIRPKKLEESERLNLKSVPLPFVKALSNSIYSTFQLMFLILGTSILFQLMFLILGTSILFFILSGVLSFSLKGAPYAYLLTGILELTKGILALPPSLSLFMKGSIILLFLSFGSLSIHMQVLSILKDTNIQYRNFLLGRISQVGISIFLFYLLVLFNFV